MFISRDKEYFLNAILSGINIHLFQNDLSPKKYTLISEYEELNIKGYYPITLDYGDLNFKDNYMSIEKTFDIDRQTRIYGYYLTVGGNLLGGERFTKAPYKIYVAGSLELRIKVYLNVK